MPQQIRERCGENKMKTKINFEVEKAKTMLIKQLYQDSFYGVLGTHPKANEENIKKGFKIKLREFKTSEKNIIINEKLATILKAYATLISWYKKDYDEYLENYLRGLIEAVELFYSEGTSAEELTKNLQPWATGMQPWSLFMQPWATSKKVSMQPWATGK